MRMIRYGEYDGNLRIVICQDIHGFFVLDVFNTAHERLRFKTTVNEELMGKTIIKTSVDESPESIIDFLLDSVRSGTHKKCYWVFSRNIQDDLLKSCVKLVKEKYRRS